MITFGESSGSSLAEKQVPSELVPVDLSNGKHKSPEYLAKHSFCQVP